MKARDSTLRLKRFDVAERARKAGDMDIMVRDFEQMILDLGRQITAEEERTGIKDAAHFAYSTFAKAAAQRRDNLLTSVSDLRLKLDAARIDHDAALDELRRLEANEPRDVGAERGRGRGDRAQPSVG
jgi:flagellar protein FliJ